jgi:hypothetical protein
MKGRMALSAQRREGRRRDQGGFGGLRFGVLTVSHTQAEKRRLQVKSLRVHYAGVHMYCMYTLSGLELSLRTTE